VPPHFSQVVRQYLNPKSQTDGLAVTVHNCPIWSLDLNPLDYHVWGYMKATVCAQEVNTRELL